jgi:hypothetical protein
MNSASVLRLGFRNRTFKSTHMQAPTKQLKQEGAEGLKRLIIVINSFGG